ncbi:MAG: transposase [Sutterella wadsworthensis]
MLQGEMDAHLTGCQPTEAPPEEVDADELLQVPNKRTGFSHKTLKTEYGPLPLSVLRDRKNTFDPIIVPSTAGRSAKWTSRSSPCTPEA